MEKKQIKTLGVQSQLLERVAHLIRIKESMYRIVYDPSLRVKSADLCGVPYEVGYGVPDDDDKNVVRMAIGKDAECMILLDKEDALNLAANIISFAAHMDEMNDPEV